MVPNLADVKVAVGDHARDGDRANLLQRAVQQHEFRGVGQREHNPIEGLET